MLAEVDLSLDSNMIVLQSNMVKLVDMQARNKILDASE